MHAKFGDLALENDFLSGALGKAGLLPIAKIYRCCGRAQRQRPSHRAGDQAGQRLLPVTHGIKS